MSRTTHIRQIGHHLRRLIDYGPVLQQDLSKEERQKLETDCRKPRLKLAARLYAIEKSQEEGMEKKLSEQ